VKASLALDQAMPVRLWLLSDQEQVVIAVWDANSRPPVRSQAEADDEAGRGLQLIEALSTYWNWYRTVHERGKVVWAVADGR
jgi:hypothetical protein